MVNRFTKGLITALPLALLMMGWRGHVVCANPPKPTEYEVKAAYLYNFAKFVDWPSAAISSGHFCVGVLGEDPLDHALDTVLAGKSIDRKHLEIRYFHSPEEAEQCQVLFINLSPVKLTEALEHLSAKPILTVADRPGFIQSGGIIAFQAVQNTIRFDVNLKAADKAQLKISSQLLKVAHRVVGASKLPSP